MAMKPCRECGREVSTEAKVCPHCGKSAPTGKKLGCWGIGCLSVVVLIAISTMIPTSDSNDSTGSGIVGTIPDRPDPKAAAMDSLSMDFTWSKGGFETVMLVDFTFRNTGSRPIKDIEVLCRHFAPSGTEIDRNRGTVYEVVPAKGRKRVRDFNMGFIHTQAASTSCQVEDFVFAE
jgi:hypothetical protein